MKQKNESTKTTGSPSPKARPGFGAERPSRRVLEGHTRPCEDCGAVNWDFDITRGEITCEDCGLVVEENVPDPGAEWTNRCLLYTSPSPRDKRQSRMPSSA